ncbi:MAG: hypothetical protein KDA84_20625, partial [Planctomycetaceae bacterium]|nr:hypothetical protein [Planctomycetaceae bacterium]
MKRFVLSLLITGLILGSVAPLLADPPIVIFSVVASPVDPKIKQRSYTFTHYDRIEATNGQVRLAHPGWSTKMQFRRGRSISSLDKIFFVPYTRRNFEGELGLRVTTIKQFEYWEQLALLEVERSRGKKDWETAEKLLSEIQRFNPKWEPKRIAELKDLVELDRAKELIAPGGGDQKRDQGLQLLAQLVKTHPELPGLEDVYVGAYINLAEKARKAENFEQVHQLLAVTSASYPESEPVEKLQNELMEEAVGLVEKAQTADQNGDRKEALHLALSALTRSPTIKIRDDVLPFLKKYQILKVACYEDAGAFEPFNAIQPLEKQMLPLLYEHIVQPDESGRNFLLGPLVNQLDEKDFGKLCIIDLVPQQRFSNGSPIASHDVVNTIRLLRDPTGDAYDPEWDRYVEGATVDGPYRLKVKLRQHTLPRSLLTIPITQFTTVQPPIRGSKDSMNPVVSGAFEVAPRLPDGSLALAANE